MTNSISFSGQWIGHFVYGQEYGEGLHGEKVQFRLFLEDLGDVQFKVTSVDIEGIGAKMDTAAIKGFLTDDFINFTKEYSKYYLIDEKYETCEDTSTPKPRLSYTGQYNFRTNSFSCQWELWANEELAGMGSIVDIFTGTWEMTKDNP